MPIGPLIRKCFGPLEHSISECYRSFFVDLDALTSFIRVNVPSPSRILEVGCGEGAMTERLVAAYRQVPITAIDISPSLGRLFRGQPSSATFLQATVQEVAAQHPASFDLVILADVIHHVPTAQRSALFTAIRDTLMPGGSFIFKDWARSRAPIHLITAILERYVTGDDVHYCTAPELSRLACAEMGAGTVQHQAHIPPWANNVVFHIARPHLIENDA